MNNRLAKLYRQLLKKDFPPPKTNPENLNQERKDFLHSASSTDCTGLIPSAPTELHEVESYEQVRRFLPPESTEEE